MPNVTAPDRYTPPKPSAGDAAHALVRGVVSSVPYIGGIGAEFFAMVISPPVERRRDEWADSIAEGIRQFEAQQRCVIKDLRDSPAFIDIVIHATAVAMRASQKEKLESLRNAVMNAALGGPSENLQQMFIEILDAFTPWHIQVMKQLQIPGNIGRSTWASPTENWART